MFNYLILAGLDGLRTTLVQQWIGPAALLVIAALSIKFLIDRNFRMLASFVVIGAIVAVLIYGTDLFFGQNGTFKKAVEDGAKQVQVISPTYFSD